MEKLIDKILNEIEECILTNQYRRIESENIELKDFSFEGKVKWDSVMQTVCAFLNTDNGIIIMGIYEDVKDKKYELRGFNFDHEGSLKEALKRFTDELNHPKEIINHIHLEQKDFMGKKLMVMYVDSLPADEKFVFYKKDGYERIMSADELISPINLEKQLEYKEEVRNAKELQPVVNAKLTDLDKDKLNEYIKQSNSEFKTQNLLTSIEDAKQFLTFNGMYRNNRPTILGMLVCGNNLSYYLNFRCQVDAYVEMPVDLPVNKKVITNNVIPLLVESYNFVLRNIQTGISVEKGGTRTFEYPLELIRECINNSLAHRDYTIDQFVNVNILPSKHIQIKNPVGLKNNYYLST